MQAVIYMPDIYEFRNNIGNSCQEKYFRYSVMFSCAEIYIDFLVEDQWLKSDSNNPSNMGK